VRFGFLRLDAEETRWVVDEQKIDEHAEELARQLGACGSVMAWVQAWNSYAFRFLATNMGKPAACFGRAHVDMMIDVFTRIERKLFARLKAPSGGGGGGGAPASDPADHLRAMIRARFPDAAADLPTGFLRWPTELGGLELRDPFVPLFAVREALPKRPVDVIKRAREEDDQSYESKRAAFRAGEVGAGAADAPRRAAGEDLCDFSEEEEEQAGPEDVNASSSGTAGTAEFMPRREYTRFAEQTSAHLRTAFDELLSEPEREDLEPAAATQVAFDALMPKDVGAGTSTPGFSINWNDLDAYWQWTFDLHARDMEGRFGGLGVGERTHLPVGLVETLKSERTRWLG
jgi:hypothetical protein